jgi:DNA-3-methyladenine glycosylase I
MKSLIEGHDGLLRCAWCGDDELYKAYHDKEWGRPAWDDRSQFEFMVLESAQAGLSWITILKKREAYRSAYARIRSAYRRRLDGFGYRQAYG